MNYDIMIDIGMGLVRKNYNDDFQNYPYNSYQSNYKRFKQLMSIIKESLPDLIKLNRLSNSSKSTSQVPPEANYSQSLALEHKLYDLLKTINNPKSDIFNQLAKKTKLYSASILTFAQDIHQLLQSHPHLQLTHRSNHSESVLLAGYLSQNSWSITIITNNHMKWEHLIVRENEVDPQGSIKNTLEKCSIKLISYNDKDRIDELTKQSTNVIIYDIFAVSKYVYQPYLLKYLLNKRQNKTILYSSHYQQSQIQSYQAIMTSFIPLKSQFGHMVERITNQRINQILIQFLKEQINHPQKQDIIIFYLNNNKNYELKIKQLININSLNDHVMIINKKIHQTLPTNKNKIFLAKNTLELQQWNYNYQNVLYVVDFGYDDLYYLDYNIMSYVEGTSYSTIKQLLKRQSYVGTYKVGRYCYSPLRPQLKPKQIDHYEDISLYCYNMIDYQLQSYLQINNKRVMGCIDSMVKAKIIELKDNSYQILNKGINNIQINLPNIFFKHIVSTLKDHNKKIQNLIAMSLGIIGSRGCLRKEPKLQIKTSKPQQIWRQSGYLHSALLVLTKLQFYQRKQNGQLEQEIQTKLSSIISKKTSKMVQYEDNPFGHLFDLYANENDLKTKQQGEWALFIKNNSVNQNILQKVKDIYEEIREKLQIQIQTILEIEWKDLEEVMVKIIEGCGMKNVSIYSGSSRIGYLNNQLDKGISAHKKSLVSLLNQKPSIIFIFRMYKSMDNFQFLMCNRITNGMYMELFGQLPLVQKKSQNEAEIQFHGISSAVCQGLWKKYGTQIELFEKQNACIVDRNEEISLIMIHCSINKEKQIKEKFEALLKKFKDQLLVSVKIQNYVGNTNLALGGGGQAVEVIKDNYITKCKVWNLSQECTEEDLLQLFSDFIVIKKLYMIDELNSPKKKDKKPTRAAFVQLNSQKDFYTFRRYFNECVYFDLPMYITPIESEVQTIEKQIYLRAKWFAWKSMRKALIQFETEQSANKAFESMTKNPQFGGEKNIKSKIQGNKLYLQGLSQKTDQISLQGGMVNFGVIKNIQILKIPMKQNPNDDQLLKYQVFKALNNDQNKHFKVHQIKKKKNGLRTAKVTFDADNDMLAVINQLNKMCSLIGYGGLHFTMWYNHPIHAPPNYLEIYMEILSEIFKNFANSVKLKVIKTKDKRKYIILKSSNKVTLNNVVQQFTACLAGEKIKLTNEQLQIVLTEIGLSNLLDLQQTYNCKIIADLFARTLKVITIRPKVKKIQEDIKKKLNANSFHYRVSLNTKTTKHLDLNPDKYKCMEINYKIARVQFDKYSKCLILEGSATNIQSCLNYLMNLIQSLSKSSQEMINADLCLICCEDPKRPYRLQNCGHSFCMKCLIDCINMGLGDVTLFPLKCPHCSQLINIGDLQLLVNKQSWPKMLSISVNKYVGTHSQDYTFCYTAGCKQVSKISYQTTFKCDACKIAYCLKCKELSHLDLTCQEAKQGTEMLFKKFMMDNNIRKCPYKTCGMPIQRTDGCYRVTCSRCNKSMCFKCQADKMIAYDNYNDCYKHLTDAHGGYW